MVVDVTMTSDISVGKPKALFETSFGPFDVAPDGRFLMAKPVDDHPVNEINLVQNWLDDLRSRTAR